MESLFLAIKFCFSKPEVKLYLELFTSGLDFAEKIYVRALLKKLTNNFLFF